ncbi:MAG: hypothetical protein A2Z88_11325 [Omnitrophica WOR_2 bacterium GWA2_47_8]|nr:MAG: hypothetical protein A2Z88_11325 [Omnitrophica WOR_2 bacterium GWA2_47_8]
MWVKKTEQAFEADKNRRGFFWSSVVFFTVIIVFCVVTGKLFGPEFEMGGPTESPGEVVAQLPFIFGYSVILGIIVTWLLGWNYRKTYGKNYPLLCDRCGKTKPEGPDGHCACGGRYISIDRMKWVEK